MRQQNDTFSYDVISVLIGRYQFFSLSQPYFSVYSTVPTKLTMESSTLIISRGLQILEQEGPQRVRAGEIRGHYTQQAPASLTAFRFV